MSTGTVDCPAPGCATSWSNSLAPNVLIRLIDLHKKTAHALTAAPAPHSSGGAKAEKVKRPSISTAGTKEEWTYFLQRWTDYKAATHLTGPDLVYQLLNCRNDELRKDLTRTFGSLSSSDETTVLSNIMTLAVRQKNIMVARVQLQKMRQDRDEPVRAFAARLRGQARVCGYQIQCTCKALVETMVRDALIRGLEDEEIRLDILGKPKLDIPLTDVLQYADAKESGKRSASRLLIGSNTSFIAATSSYHKQEKMRLQDQRNTKPTPNPCGGHCGQTGHGKSHSERLWRCPTLYHTCTKCKKPHHFESVCRQSRRLTPTAGTSTSSSPDDSTATFDTLCTLNVTESSEVSTLTLDHHVYNDLCNVWERRPSDPQPFIDISIQALPADAKALGLPQTLMHPTPLVPHRAIADTGCQSCLAGTQLLTQLKLDSRRDLTPVTLKMTSANNRKIDILGALAMRLYGLPPSGTSRETRQIVYFTDSTDRLFLSKQACVSLGIISNKFPTIEAAMEPKKSNLNPAVSCSVSSDVSGSGHRKDAPAPPDNCRHCSLCYLHSQPQKKIEKRCAIDYYASSTFNVCEHQPLPKMSGPPMNLMVDPNARPIAYYSPIPVPVH